MGMPDALKNEEKGAAVLYSGGMDSTVVVADLIHKGYKVYPIAMDDGSLNYQLRRRVAIELSLQKLGIFNRLIEVRTPDPEPLRIDRTSFGFVPGLKMIMILSAMAVCQTLNVTELYVGYNMDNQRGGYLDEGATFMKTLADLYNTTYSMEHNTEHFFGKDIQIVNPFSDKEKWEMVKHGVSLGVDFSTTISCRQVRAGGGLIHCGSCSVCARRRMSFLKAEAPDTTIWLPRSICAMNQIHYSSFRTIDWMFLTDGITSLEDNCRLNGLQL